MPRPDVPVAGLSRRQRALKRAFDLTVAIPLLVPALPVIAIAWLAATIDTCSNGMFTQERVGRDGTRFTLLKIRTMRAEGGSTVTTADDARITTLGAWLRRSKIDELPQLINVVRGEMSLIGPRPDVPGFADLLTGADRLVLGVRPGITGPAAVAFRHEQELLATVDDPEAYNRDVLWPAKVALNRSYVEDWTLVGDVRWLVGTIRSVLAPHRRRSEEGSV